MTFLLATNDLRIFRLISTLQRGEGGHSGKKPYFSKWLNNFATDCSIFHHTEIDYTELQVLINWECYQFFNRVENSTTFAATLVIHRSRNLIVTLEISDISVRGGRGQPIRANFCP